jgi:hypothetical protein
LLDVAEEAKLELVELEKEEEESPPPPAPDRRSC